jgi:hypothetical protein
VACRTADHESVGSTALAEHDTPRAPCRRDAASASWRQARAVELALLGRSYDSIALEVGYANRGNAWRTVQKALNERVVEGVDELRALELDRLDSLHEVVWPKAMAGDLAAASVILRIMDKRARLLSLYPSPEANQPPVLMVVQSSAPATMPATEGGNDARGRSP